jgi:GrpB-like predicted nucleotidyltransferase (UPF0157 family)/RimJ/RimL family protein N-acetyltransferase
MATPMRKVELTSHDPEWAAAYQTEVEQLTAVFQSELVAIHHIGSTAVPGIKAKPIIDIMIEVRDIERVDSYNEAMQQLGYIAKGEHGIDGRRYFRKGSDFHHTHHIHTYQTGHPEVARHLNFRDYLIAHPQVAQAYSRLKEELARKYVTEPPRYTNSKTKFIRAVEKKAVVWRSQQAIATERLYLLPLSQARLRTCLENRLQLAQELGVHLADELFGGPVPRAIRMKLGKMADLPEADHLWVTYWLIVPQEKLTGAGLVGFKGYPNEEGEAEIGYGMFAPFQNQGYMTEAVAALLDWALARPECTAVIAETAVTNQPSIRVLQKVGMIKTGEKDGHFYWRKAKKAA